MEVVTSSSAWKRQVLWFTECLLSLGTFGALQPKQWSLVKAFGEPPKRVPANTVMLSTAGCRT